MKDFQLPFVQYKNYLLLNILRNRLWLCMIKIFSLLNYTGSAVGAEDFFT